MVMHSPVSCRYLVNTFILMPYEIRTRILSSSLPLWREAIPDRAGRRHSFLCQEMLGRTVWPVLRTP